MIKSIRVTSYENKFYHSVGRIQKNYNHLEKYTQEFITEKIIENIVFYKTSGNEDMAVFAQGLQYDLSMLDKDYSWCVIATKKQIYTNHLKTSSDLFFHCKIMDNEKQINIPKIRDTEILIFKKKAIFESVLKNILSGRFYEVELKHIVILLSVIIFFTLAGLCNKEYTEDDKNLSFFEEKVCLNKRNILSSIAMMFIFVIVSSMIKKKLDRGKQKIKPAAKEKIN
jgi:hypothetical protein